MPGLPDLHGKLCRILVCRQTPQEAQDLLSNACPKQNSAQTSSGAPSTAKQQDLPTSSFSALGNPSLSFTTTRVPTANTGLPDPNWPSAIIGPACVPIHGLRNSSIPDRGNWTDGIVWYNGSWRNSSCTPNATNGNHPLQVTTSGTMSLMISMSSIGILGALMACLLVA